ncbi:hypothetical protein U4E84_13960 [Halorubrum sp. AD140]|uniref:hypothetical protein n=1 Tax=Halorubrum sp. AD140 TaxID=3050073 RepID=UPI002ACCB15F|nr:hypothetical protein [Halorubrum sp. AD140]MDZ5812451.1 hypothetical protein [Halorubrum sp. AD140]
MHRRELVAATTATVTTGSVAGCLGLGEPDSGRLDLTVRNDGDEAIDVDVVVEGDDGTTYAEESDRVDAGVARAFEVVGGETGRHEVTVTGDDWEGRLAWDAGICATYDGTVAVDAGNVEVAGECVDRR